MPATSNKRSAAADPRPQRIGLFASCLVDLFRPNTAAACEQLLDRTGFTIDLPLQQTCCGQPAYNAGDRKGAIKLAVAVVEQFAECDAIVTPSGSCASILRNHYPGLLAGEKKYASLANEIAEKSYEICCFLDRYLAKSKLKRISNPDGLFPDQLTIGYHHSCSGLRELGIYQQPRNLIAAYPNLQLIDIDDDFNCCGFGGMFAIKYPSISAAMADKVINLAEKLQVKYITGGDWGCLLNLAGRLARRKIEITPVHILDLLAFGRQALVQP